MLPINNFLTQLNIFISRDYGKVSEKLSLASFSDVSINFFDSLKNMPESGNNLPEGTATINIILTDAEDITEENLDALKKQVANETTLLFSVGDLDTGLKENLDGSLHLFEIEKSESAGEYFASVALAIAKAVSKRSVINIDGLDIAKVVRRRNKFSLYYKESGEERMAKIAMNLSEEPVFMANSRKENFDCLVVLGGDVMLMESSDFMAKAFEHCQGNIIFSTYEESVDDETEVIILASYDD